MLLPTRLRAALRQAPNVILVGEIRDRESVEIALNAAETGHLVLSTLHTIDAGKTINRILGVFNIDEENQIRTRLAGTALDACQRLMPKKLVADVSPPLKQWVQVYASKTSSCTGNLEGKTF